MHAMAPRGSGFCIQHRTGERGAEAASNMAGRAASAVAATHKKPRCMRHAAVLLLCKSTAPVLVIPCISAHSHQGFSRWTAHDKAAHC